MEPIISARISVATAFFPKSFALAAVSWPGFGCETDQEQNDCAAQQNEYGSSFTAETDRVNGNVGRHRQLSGLAKSVTTANKDKRR